MRQYTRAEIDQLSKTARDWERNDILRAKWSARFAWILAVVMGLLAIAAVGALAMLVPLKQVVPYVIQVDRTTGQTRVVNAMTGKNPVSYDESLKRHMIAQYVESREGWVPLAENEMIHTVELMSADEEAHRFDIWFRKTNPQSPQIRFANVPFVKVEIRAISFINPSVAQVRYDQTVYQHTGPAEVGRYIATLTFRITSKPPLDADLQIDPVGFEVTNYQTSPEN
ncbi:MAG: type IV secretion system protein [Sphingomonadales bacterium]|nr:type IV secretion system protein [Sphingomonadales bacterium]MDE2570755.1 type IV secretion system protein [Sphingomonadales bacterium]